MGMISYAIGMIAITAATRAFDIPVFLAVLAAGALGAVYGASQ